MPRRRKSNQATLGCSLGKLTAGAASPGMIRTHGKIKRIGMSPSERIRFNARARRVAV